VLPIYAIIISHYLVVRTKEQVENKDISYIRKLTGTESAEDVISLISERYKMPIKKMLESYKKPLREKKIAVFALRNLTGMTNREIGRLFKISYSAVSKICKNIEDTMGNDKRLKKEIEGIISHFKV
jgi:chromosomal replication initiation ATPase DnaA